MSLPIEQAIEAFMRGFAFCKSYAHPYVVERVGDLRVMRDGPGKRPYTRLTEIVAHGIAPEEAVRQITACRPGRHGLGVVEATGADHEDLKARYKRLGYRLIATEPLFVKDLSGLPSDGGDRVCRVVTQRDADRVYKTPKRRQAFQKYLTDGEAPLRMYVAFEGDEVVGSVQSVEAIEGSRWVANLTVRPEHRRKGIGTELMRAMLSDDFRFGGRHSVLLASTSGSKLYPLLGYEQVGLLQLFMPMRPRSN